MFYENTQCAFKILGVFYVERAGVENKTETQREHTAIAYRIQGESRFLVGEETQIATASDITYIPAHTDYIRSATSEKLLVIHLKGFGEIGNRIEVIQNVPHMEPFFQNLLSAWLSQDPTAYNRSINLLYSLFEALQRIKIQQNDSLPAILRPGVDLLQKQYSNPSLRISDLAKACFISETHFRNLFYRHFGKSPCQELTAMRLRYACELLVSGYYSQKEIAWLSGFSNVK